MNNEFPKEFLLNSPFVAFWFCQIAEFFFCIEDYEKAKGYYKKTLKWNSSSYKSLCGLGFCALLGGDLEEAGSSFEQAKLIYPGKARAYKGLGDLFKEMKDFERSESFYKQAISLNDNYLKAKLALVDLYMDFEKLDDALWILENCASKRYVVRYWMARVFYKQEEYTKALWSMILLFEEKPDRLELAQMIGMIFYAQGNLENAIKYFEKYNNSLSDFEVLYLTATSYDRLNNPSKALHFYKKALEVNPNSKDALYRLGLQANKDRDFIKARDFFERVLVVNSDLEFYIKVAYSLAYTEKSLGNLSRAVELYEQCLASGYNKNNVLYYLAELLDSMRDYSRAQMYRRMISTE